MKARALVDPIWATPGDVLVTTLQRPVILPPGSQAAALACLICGDALESCAVDQVTLWPVAAPVCGCGRVGVVAFLVHASCPLPGYGELIELARAQLWGHHGSGDGGL